MRLRSLFLASLALFIVEITKALLRKAILDV
jgi:hypothetical protein